MDWPAILDSIRDGTNIPPPVVGALRLPGIEGWQRGQVWGTWVVDPDMLTAVGTVFGGYLAALADSYVALAMMTTLAEDEWFSTSDLRTAFFRPVMKGTIEIAAEVLNRGKRMAHVEAIFVNDEDKIVAKATATQVIQPLIEPP